MMTLSYHEPTLSYYTFLHDKLWELVIETLPLLAIGEVSQLAIVLREIIRCMLGHQLGILGVPEYSTQAIDHGQVPHR